MKQKKILIVEDDTPISQGMPGALEKKDHECRNDTIEDDSERVSDGVFVYSDNQYKKVLFRDILFIEAQSMATILHCALNKQYRISLSSNNVVAQLAYPGIVRSSRSYYVNIHQIDSIKNDELIIHNHIVPMSKSYKDNILTRLSRITQK